MRVLVTGAAGFIGSHLAERLAGEGHEVTGVDNFETGRGENWPSLKCDVTDRGIFYEIANAAAPQLVIHCAASYKDPDKWHDDTDTNVNGAINVSAVARHHGARVIYFQTALIYGNNPYIGQPVGMTKQFTPLALATNTRGNPESSYAISKLAAEQYLRLSGVPLLTLRLANIYGPRNLSGPIPTFYKRLSAGEPCTVVDSRRDFVYIDDLVNLVTQAIREEATGTYHVSTGSDYSIGEVFEAVRDALDIHLDADPAVTPRGADDAPTILLDPSATQQDFGWRATTDLDEGIREAVDWYSEHGVGDTYTHLKMKERA